MKSLLVLIASLLIGLPVLAQERNLDPESQRQLADGLYAREMYGLAATEYNAYLTAHPDTKDADACWFRLGECYRHIQDSPSAEKAYRTVFTRYPDSEFRFRAGFQRASLFLEADRPVEAGALFDALLTQSPTEDIAAASLFFKGQALLQQEDAEGAGAAFNEVRQKYPKSEYYAYALLKLSALLVKSDDPAKQAESLELLKTAEQKAKTDRMRAETLYQLAERHFELKDYDTCAPYYLKLINTYPDDQRAREARLRAAWAMHNADLYADALKTATEALKEESESLSDWLYLKANCERQLSRNAEAVETYQRFLAANKEGDMAAAARYELALTYYRMKQYPEAISTLTAAAPDAESRESDLWVLAESHAALKQYDQAIQFYRLLIRDFPDSPVACEASYRLAYQLQQRNDNLEAARYFIRLVETCATNALAPRALFAAGHCLALEGEHADAVRAWGDLHKTYPDHEHAEEALYRRAMSEIHLDRQDDAMASLRGLLKKHPKTTYLTDAHYWKGMLLLKADNALDAEASFKTAAAANPREALKRDITYQHAVSVYLQEKYDEAAALMQPLLDTPIAGRLTPDFMEWLSAYRLERGEYAQGRVPAQLLCQGDQSPEWQQVGWILIARSWKGEKQADKAADANKKALALKAATAYAAEAALELGLYELSQQSPDAAVGYLGKAAEWGNQAGAGGIRPRAYRGLGKAHQALGNFEDAARFYMSVAILYDSPEIVPECLYESAGIYARLGLKDEASRTATELKSRYPKSEWATRPIKMDENP